MIDPRDVTACLVTRGNVPLDRIVETLPYGDVMIWDNSKQRNLRVFGRYQLAQEAQTPWVFWQDDDVVFTEHEALMAVAAVQPHVYTAANAHGAPHGYHDLALPGVGSLCPRELIEPTWRRWFDRHGWDGSVLTPVKDDDDAPFKLADGVLYEADFIFGTLVGDFRHVDLPYERLYADDDTRLCRQSWQADLKAYVTSLAREIRDGE